MTAVRDADMTARRLLLWPLRLLGNCLLLLVVAAVWVLHDDDDEDAAE